MRLAELALRVEAAAGADAAASAHVDDEDNGADSGVPEVTHIVASACDASGCNLMQARQPVNPCQLS